METEESAVPIRTKALRLWPGVAAAVAIVVFRLVIPAFIPDAGILGMAAALAGTLAIVIWWLFFSRASWTTGSTARSTRSGCGGLRAA